MSVERLNLNVESQNIFKNLPISGEIKRINANELSYNNFFWNYMHKNIPVLISSTADHWLCRQQWTSSKSKINFHNLKKQIENVKVPVANCSKEYFNSHEKCDMEFYEYLDYWEQRSKDINENTLYLKDWHLKASMPNYNFYKVPEFFASDWLNEFLIDKCKDDYRFVYMGPEGSWTPFHADVFSSFSWSTNIVGLKKWILIVPHDELKLMNSLGNYPFEIDEQMLLEKGVRFFIVMQKENESLFVPSGWYHQVWNLTDTISINHNWFNGCNIDRIWKNLSENMQRVIKEIDDCREMDNFEEHCEVMLKATFGMNYHDFFEILEHIALKRQISFKNKNETILFDAYQMNDVHTKFDLMIINKISKIMRIDQKVKANRDFVSRCDNLVNITELYSNC